LELVDILISKLKDDNCKFTNIKPWYKGFNGEIECIKEGVYTSKGKIQKISNGKLRITELPIKTWTEDYKDYLNDLVNKNIIIKDYENYSTDSVINFELKFNDEDEMDKIINTGVIMEQFNLVSKISTSNMHMFNKNRQIMKYENIVEILNEYYVVRLDYYTKRKDYLLSLLAEEIKYLSNKSKFILMVVEELIKVFKIPKGEVLKQLINNKFDKKDGSYNYLTKIPLDHFTKEETDKLIKNLQEKEVEMKLLEEKTNKQLWIDDLNILRPVLIEFLNKSDE